MSAAGQHYEFPEDQVKEYERQVRPSDIKVVVRYSEKIGELVAALSKAQLEFGQIIKDQKNPYYNSKYADLSSVISATQSALAKNGLVVFQHPSTDVDAQRVTITSRMAHISDQWTESELTLPATMLGKDGKPRFDAQSCGAAMTYGRRYAMQGLTGTSAELDDDANSAVGIGSKEAAQAVAERKIADYKSKKPTDLDKYADVKNSLSDCKNADDLNFLLEGWRGDKALVADQNVRAFVHSRAKALNLIFDDSSRTWVQGAK